MCRITTFAKRLLLYNYLSLLILTILLIFGSTSIAQTSDDNKTLVYIKSIEVAGNEKTKEQVILRESTISANTLIQLANLSSELSQTKQNIYNLGLFNNVEVALKGYKNDSTIVTITVVERFYHIPVPVFELADRNFNVWWNDQNKSFKRTIYGLTYYHENMRGRDERLWLGINLGFSQGVVAGYSFPYVNKKKTIGLKYIFKFQRSKQLVYNTFNNKHLFFEGDDFTRKEYTSGAILRFKNALYDKHFLGTHYFNTTVSDSIAILNPNYFLDGERKQQYLQLSYRFESDHRDFKDYPLSGYYWGFEVEKLGLNIFNDVDQFNWYLEGSKYFDFSKHFYMSTYGRVKVSTPTKQSFYVQEGLGNNQHFVRGYENYVVDGQHYALFKLDFKRRLFAFTIDNSKFIKSGQFNKTPMAFYLKTYIDAGIVGDRFYHQNNPLNNEWLVGGGIGLDIATWYDYVFRIEYSLNKAPSTSQKKVENGVYLHFSLDILHEMNVANKVNSLKSR